MSEYEFVKAIARVPKKYQNTPEVGESGGGWHSARLHTQAPRSTVSRWIKSVGLDVQRENLMLINTGTKRFWLVRWEGGS